MFVPVVHELGFHLAQGSCVNPTGCTVSTLLVLILWEPSQVSVATFFHLVGLG